MRRRCYTIQLMMVDVSIIDALIWMIDEIEIKMLIGGVASRVTNMMRCLLMLLLMMMMVVIMVV